MVRTTVPLCFFLAILFQGLTWTSPVIAQGIKVGVILPLTGKLARFGEIEKKSFMMAVDEINKEGGINGTKIDVIIENTAGRAHDGRLTVEKLILQDGVVVISGGYSSSVTWAAAEVAQKKKVPFLVSTASADKITELGWEYIFRLNPPVSEHPRALASFLREVANIKTVAISYEIGPGEFGARKFSRVCRTLGLRILMKDGYKAGTMDFRPLLSRVKGNQPDLVYLISQASDAALLMSQAKEVGLSPKLFVGRGPGFTSSEFRKTAGEASEYVMSATLWAPSVPYPGAKDYTHRFLEKYYFAPEYHGAEAYAAMYVIADALKRAKSASPRDVRDALAETDTMTAFGPVKFVSYGKKTQQNELPTLLVQWINGKLETVWPRKVASAKYIYPLPKWAD
jgi:branched-chain amino acid transport system substrate-binding protein